MIAAVLGGTILGFIGSMPISGPISLLVLHRGMLARYREGWAIGLGGAIPEGIYCALAILGVSAIRERFIVLDFLAKGLGIVWLFAIGLYFLLTRQKHLEAGSVAKPSGPQWAGPFCLGLSISTFNPTFFFTWSATVTMLYSIANITFNIPEGVVFATSVVAGSAVWFAVLLALLGRFRERFPLWMLHRVIRGIGLVLVTGAILWAAWTLFA
jgi:threonine/homoserine/homoserine lactone efflux protein